MESADEKHQWKTPVDPKQIPTAARSQSEELAVVDPRLQHPEVSLSIFASIYHSTELFTSNSKLS